MGGLFGAGSGGNNTVQPMAAGLRVQTSAYGLCVPLVYGRTRVAGNLIWFGDFMQYANTSSAGGKGGGGGGSSTSWTYSTSFAMALCEGAVQAIWAGWKDKTYLPQDKLTAMFTLFSGTDPQTPWSYLNSKHLGEDLAYKDIAYVAAANYDLGEMSNLPNHTFELSGMLSATATGAAKIFTATVQSAGAPKTFTVAVNAGAQFQGGGGSTLYKKQLQSPAHGFAINDIVQFTTTGILPAGLLPNTNYYIVKKTIGDFSVAINAGKAIPITPTDAGTGTHSVTKYVKSSVLNSTGHGFVDGIKVNVFTSGTLPSGITAGYDYYITAATANNFSLTLSLGKTLKAIEVSTMGSGIHSISVPTDASSPRDIVIDFLTNTRYGAGFPSSSIGSTSDFSAFCKATGIGISPAYTEQKPAHEMLSDIMQITNSACYFSEGVLKIVPLSDTSVTGNGAIYTAPNTPIYDVNDDDFIVNGDDPIKVSRASNADAYNHVQVEYVNKLNQYNVEIVDAKDQVSIDTYGLRTKDPIVAHCITDGDTAKVVAQMLLQRSVYVRNTYEFTLGIKYCLLEPSDIITINDSMLGFNSLPVRILSIEEDDQGMFAITAEDYPQGVSHAALYPSTYGTGWAVNYGVTPAPVATPAFFEKAATKSLTGLAVGVAVTGSSSDWGGCEIWVSYDGSTYKYQGKTEGGARYGVLTNAPTSAVNQAVGVALSGIGGQILSGTAIDAINLSTLCLVGNEYFAYTTATLTNVNAYNLTAATRGAYNTVAAAHSIGDKFVRVDEAIVYSDDLDLSMIGKTIYFKFRSYNQFNGAIEDLASVAAYSYTVTGVMAKLPPTDVASITATQNTTGVTFNWSDITDGDRKDYELRNGATWATALSLGFFGSNNASIPPQLAGTSIYQVKARDVFLNNSNIPASVSVTIAAPLSPAVSAAIIGAEFKLSITAPVSGFTIDHYEIRTGSVWASGTYVGTTGGLVYQAPVNFSGTVNFMVAAVDIAGNVGAAGSASVTVLAPTAPTVTTQVIDNNVLFYWNDTHQTLPIATYELRKGATYASATIIGTKSGLFTTVFETQAGVFTYWVTPIDTAGNYGISASISATVSQPPDYVLKSDFNSTLNGTLSSAIKDTNGVNLPLNTADQFGTHFSSRSWASMQAQITAGYPILAEPAAASGYYEETINYGTTFASSKVTLSATIQMLDGSPTVTYTISTSPNGSTWTDYVGVTQVYATNFAYVKIRIAVASSAGHDLATITGINVKLDVKLKNDAGSVSAVSTDNSAAITGAAIGGTTVLFNVPFINVTSITLTPQGTTSPVTAIYDFIGSTVNPLGFKVYLYNSAGARVSGTVSWSAKGN